MGRWREKRAPAHGPLDAIEDALAIARAGYADARAGAAAQLYAAHKLAGEARHQRAIAESTREEARARLARRDATGARRMVEATRTALELARDAELAHAELRAHADAALDALRRLGQAIAELERDRLRAIALFASAPRSAPSVVCGASGASSWGGPPPKPLLEPVFDESLRALRALRSASSIEEARHALSVLEAERELDAELAGS